MTEPTITCPTCATRIPLTESLAAPLIAATRREFEARLAVERQAIAEREAGVARAHESLGAEVESRVSALRATVSEEAVLKARAASAAELADLRAVLTEREEKLAAAQAAQAAMLRKERALADAQRELDLTIETRVNAGLAETREAARAEAEAAARLKVAEKEQTIAAMGRQIEDLKRRAEQGSQQLQGEVLELDLEALLRARFPGDVLEPVAKGATGADLVQRVIAPGGIVAGAILWEVKRTKGWTDAWVAKLKGDQRAAGAEIALLMSAALPKAVDSFDLVDGVWVAHPRIALPLATALRLSLIQLSGAKAARDGQGTKMELVYEYLTGPRFRHRVEAIVERFRDMSEDLDREKKTTMRLWAKREMQIQGVIEATVGMYGDLQGIAGKALAEIEGLDAPMLPGLEA